MQVRLLQAFLKSFTEASFFCSKPMDSWLDVVANGKRTFAVSSRSCNFFDGDMNVKYDR